ncbi:TldD/PmbA family protein [Waterburya agarophytonicola K14]|uniref:TldD/PmbA family protein n=1 Tax=Waterburya agarophytonicola KI4 TaxID=2874699 RepID=A0A964BPL6_9CYAN|nr:TldD/PmbA family protein [Waterburya agarophytonicola]MCC0176949.1 TldD/PmbA family protein [Waterburya agarophytonicola KI4]
MKDKVIEQVIDLAKKKGVEAEVYYVSSQDTPIEFANNRLKSLETKASEGIALRVIADNKLGFASSTDLTRLSDLVDAAIATAEIGDPVEFDFARDFNGIEDKKEFQFPKTAKLVEVGEDLIAKVHQYNPDILVDISFHSRSGRAELATTTDVYTEQNGQSLSAVLSGNLVRGEDFLQAYSYEVSRDRQPDYEAILNKLIKKYQRAEGSAKIKSGTYPVLFTPSAVSSTMGRMFGTIFSGQSLVQKASPLTDKLGEKMFDDRINVYEDPTIGVSACDFDDEGVPTSKKYLVNQGVIEQFYWDRRWAARYGIESSGNGFRGGISLPSPSLANVCLTPGSTTVDDLIAGMEEGIIVDQVLGAGQSNILAGEFSVNIDLGYKVEGGQIIGRVKDTMVAGNIFEAFSNLIDLSDRAEWVGGSSYVPHILFAKLGVAARG